MPVRRFIFLLGIMVSIVIVGIPLTAQTDEMFIFCQASPFNQLIPKETTYTLEPRIETIRQNQEKWSAPIYRLNPADNLPPLRSVINDYSSRTELWPIPLTAVPATASDHHMIVLSPQENMIYEMWNARWQNNASLRAGGMHAFSLDGPGISNPPNERVTASGFSVIGGMLILEDFVDVTTGELNPDQRVNHALSMSLPRAIVAPREFVAPAVGGEQAGEALQDGIAIGTRFALGNGVTDEILESDYWHPLTRAIAFAARDYGVYVNDTNTAPRYGEGYAGNIRIEVGLVEQVFNAHNDRLIGRIEREMATLIDAYGIWQLDYPLPDSASCFQDDDPR